MLQSRIRVGKRVFRDSDGKEGRASQRDEGVAPGVRTRMAWGPQLRAAVERVDPLLPTLRPAHMVHTVSSSAGIAAGSLAATILDHITVYHA